jgi:molybdate transport system substrate-binding protein
MLGYAEKQKRNQSGDGGEDGMTRIVLAAAAAAALALAPIASAGAAEITFFCTNALKSVMQELGPQFEKASGNKLTIVYGSTGTLKARIDKSEAFDLALFGAGAIDALVKQGKLEGRSEVATSGMGVAIRKGAPKPDLSSTDAFKRTVLNAKSIAFSEDGVTGTYLKGLFQRLGIADEVKSKTHHGRGAEMVAEGKAELGVTQISEILPIAGVEVAGPLPPEVQQITAFPAAISTAAKAPDAAKALLKFLASPEAAKVMKSKGLDPPA